MLNRSKKMDARSWTRLAAEKRYASTAGAPRTFNADQRSVEVIMSKGSPVQRYYGTEKLRISRAAVDLSRLSSGIPLLDGHNQSSLSNILGRVQSARVDGDALVGKVRFNETPEGDRAMGMIERGELGTFSVGYAVSKWEITDADGNVLDPERDRIRFDAGNTFEAIRWSLLELSAVAVPADQSAVARSFGGTDPARLAVLRMQARQRMLERMSRNNDF
jgi:HK97 family phage prohead protease